MVTYVTRYQAGKNRRKGEEIVVKVSGGYAVMTYQEHRIWTNQK